MRAKTGTFHKKNEKMIRSLLFVGVLLLASCSESQVENVAEKGGHQVVNAEVFKTLLDEEGIQLVDVRTADEFSGGTIGDAVNIDFLSADFKAKIGALDKTKKTLIFCQAGGRSGKAGAIMEEMGFETVVDLSGGYGAWPHK